MGDRQVEQGDVKQDAAVAQPGDGRSLLEHSGWLDKLKHGASTIGHNASDLMHKGIEKGKEIAHDPKTQKVAHEVAHEAVKAGKEIASDQMSKVNGVAQSAKRGDINGVIRNGMPLAGEALMPHVAAIKIAKEKAAEIAAEHASPQVRAEIEKRKSAADQNPHIPHLTIDGLANGQAVGH